VVSKREIMPLCQWLIAKEEQMDEKIIHNMDEFFTLMSRTLPGGLHSFYTKLIEEGFREDQAIYFTTEWMRTLITSPPANCSDDLPDLPPDLS